MNTQDKKEEKGWQFLNVGIAGPECMMPFIQEVVQSSFERELENPDGIFSSKVDIPFEDESLDEFLCVEVYGLHGSFSTFYSELKEYKVDEITFGKEWTRAIFAMLKVIRDFIKDNTDKPQAIKNKIISVLKFTENIPILGLMSQITTLCGLVRMLECCDVDEDSPQYNDLIILHDWLVVEAGKRICKFTLMPMTMIFSDEDMKRVQPFCDYLYYGTDIGRLANEMALNIHITIDDMLEYGAISEEEANELKLLNDKYSVDKGEDEETVNSDVPNTISSESVTKAGRPKGKVVKSFHECFLVADQDREETMKKLKSMLPGKRGKELAMIILGCIEAKKISKPSFAQLKQEFGVIGNESGYNLFMREPWKIDDKDIENMTKIFS